MKKRIFVDMDDVLCEFFGTAALTIMNNPGILYPQSQYDFFRTLPPIMGAIEGINLLAKVHDVHILTKPSIRNPLCYTEKAMWVKDNLGIKWMDKLHISCDKSLFIGDYLIDDMPWKNFKGKQLQFGTAEYPNWKSIIDYFFPN